MQRASLKDKLVVIVGGVAGGASCAARLRRLSEEVSITMLERSSAVSFANCGLPYHISGTIAERSKLMLHTPESFLGRFNIDARVYSEVTSVDPKNKQVTVRNVSPNVTSQQSGGSSNEYKLKYDYLVLSCGAMPVVLPIKGHDLPGVFSLRTLDDLDKIMQYIQTNQVKSAAVIGAGFIGIEVAENLALKNIKTTIVEKTGQVMPNLDPEIAAFVYNDMRRHNVDILLNCGAVGIERKSGSGDSKMEVQLDNGSSSPLGVDMVIFAVGVRPDTDLAKRAGLKIGATGGIAVNDQMRTSDPSIFAVGDSVEILDRVSGQQSRIALAGPANRQGRLVADVIAGLDSHYPGALGTSIVKAFDVTAGSVGLTEKRAKQLNVPYRVAWSAGNSHAGYYPGAQSVILKMLYNAEGLILGAQATGKEGIDKRLDVFATAIYNKMTVHDLQYLDLAYAPPFSSAKDVVNHIATIAVDSLMGMHPYIGNDELNDALGKGAMLIDVRTKGEFDKGSIQKAQLVPVNDLRAKIGAVVDPAANRDIVVYCQVGMRGYLATRILQQKGYNVRNLLGGYTLFNELQTQQKFQQQPQQKKDASL